MANSEDKLTDILSLALSRSEDQEKTLHEQAKQIEALRKQNDELSRELTAVRQEEHPVDSLFQQNVEARAEISRLKHKLKRYKEKVDGRLSVPLSSPGSVARARLSPDRFYVGSSSIVPVPVLDDNTAKRPRLEEIVQDAVVTISRPSKSTPSTSKKSAAQRSVDAISLVAEDGENHMPVVGDKDRITSTGNEKDITHSLTNQRLDGLLHSTAKISRSPLQRPLAQKDSNLVLQDSESCQSRTKKRPWKISNIEHSSRSLQKTSENNDTLAKTRSLSREKLPPRNSRQAPQTRRLRDYPIDELSLSSFRPNPRWLDSEGMTYDQFLQGKSIFIVERILSVVVSRLSNPPSKLS